MIITDATRGCSWRPTSIAARACAHTSEADIMDCRTSYGDPPYLRTLSRARSAPALAEPPPSSACRGPLRAARFGPFTSTPERGWRSLISGELRGLLHSGDRIVASASQPVAADGAPIGFPPLHNHHVHVRKGERGVDRAVNNHWFESHGDYPPPPSPARRARRATPVALPAGYCVVVGGDADDVDVEAEVNDVRAAGAPPLVWYLQVAFRLAEALVPPGVQGVAPLSVVARADRRLVEPVRGAERAGAELVERRARARRRAAWRVAALPPQPLRRRAAAARHARRPRLPLRSSWGIAAPPHADADYALARNLSRTRARLAATGSVVCRSDAAVPTAARVDGEWYDRRGAIACVPWRYRAGDAYTVVALHEPRWRAEERVTPQHTELWLWVDEGARDSRVALPDFFTATAMDCGGEAVAGGGDLGGTPLVESAASLLQPPRAEGGGNLSYESYSEYGRYHSDPDKADGSYEYQSYEYPGGGRGAARRRRVAAVAARRPPEHRAAAARPRDRGRRDGGRRRRRALDAAAAAPRTRSIGDGSVAAARESEALELANTFRSP